MPQPHRSFQDKVAIVTGGASGLGRALCQKLHQEGARVIVTDIDLPAATALAETLCSSGGQAESLYINVTKPAVVSEVVDAVLAKYGTLDYMFNNAGIAIVGEMFDMTLAHWQRLVDVNLWGVVYGTTAAYHIMRHQGHGHIVNIASMSGLLPGPTAVAYTMTKHAIVGLSESLRVEAADLNIQISVVCPSAIETGIRGRAVVLQGSAADIFPRSRFFPPLSPEAAAAMILRGVQHNQAVITLPFWSGKLLWWLYRVSPALVAKMAVYRIRRYRQRYQSTPAAREE